jgi:hypothetical protein
MHFTLNLLFFSDLVIFEKAHLLPGVVNFH